MTIFQTGRKKTKKPVVLLLLLPDANSIIIEFLFRCLNHLNPKEDHFQLQFPELISYYSIQVFELLGEKLLEKILIAIMDIVWSDTLRNTYCFCYNHLTLVNAIARYLFFGTLHLLMQ